MILNLDKSIKKIEIYILNVKRKENERNYKDS